MYHYIMPLCLYPKFYDSSNYTGPGGSLCEGSSDSNLLPALVTNVGREDATHVLKLPEVSRVIVIAYVFI